MKNDLISKTPQKLPLVSIIITCFLLAYVFFLIISNYVSQTSLQQTIFKQFKLENERQAITLGNFFYNRKEDLVYLAESGTLKVFFENRALGMSMQYGLKQSLPPIKETFRALLDRYKGNNGSFYLRIAFLDAKGNILVEAVPSTPMHRVPTDTKKLLSPEHKRPAIILKDGGKEIIVSVAYYFKGKYSGQIVAWLKPEFLQSRLSASERKSYILSGKENILQSGKNETTLDFEIFKADLPQEFNMEDRAGRNRDMVGIKTLVYDTPFSLVTIVPVQNLFGGVRPKELLVGMGILAVIIISGAVFIYRLNLKAFNYARSLIEASLDPFVTINVDGKITDVNSATEKVTGIMRDKLIGSDFSDYFTEPEIARIAYRQVFSRGYINDYPLAIRDSSGKITDVLYNASIYRNEQGKIAGVFAVARDITEFKRIEEALRESQKRYHTLFEYSPDGILIIDAAGKIIEFNETAHRQLGYSREEFQKLSLPDIDAAWSPEEILARIGKVLETGQAEFTVRQRTKQGEVKDVYTFTKAIVLSGSPVLHVIWHDITERKKAEQLIRQSLKEKEALLREIHHRVKNNMAVVSGLLSLQAGTIKDDTMKSLFEESQQRVRSMALVHEKLYQTKDLSSVNFEDYIKSIISEI
ncbi:MAG: PAS domain S-box protein, partial [Nitrospirae bacterium]|nr:PAS domain S-box protein [Nitrospirota bacterium]